MCHNWSVQQILDLPIKYHVAREQILSYFHWYAREANLPRNHHLLACVHTHVVPLKSLNIDVDDFSLGWWYLKWWCLYECLSVWICTWPWGRCYMAGESICDWLFSLFLWILICFFFLLFFLSFFLCLLVITCLLVPKLYLAPPPPNFFFWGGDGGGECLLEFLQWK